MDSRLIGSFADLVPEKRYKLRTVSASGDEIVRQGVFERIFSWKWVAADASVGPGPIEEVAMFRVLSTNETYGAHIARLNKSVWIEESP